MFWPVILATYSNSNQNYLPQLQEEMKTIWKCFLAPQTRGLLSYNAPPFDVKTTDLSDALLAIGNQMTIFHYSGHADDKHLVIEDDGFENNQLLNVLKGTRIDLVVLNGCSTKGFVEALLKEDIGAVVATTEKVSDLTASRFSELFYRALLVGKRLPDALDFAVFELKSRWKKPSNDDGIDLEDEEVICPWQLYFDQNDPQKTQRAQNFVLLNPDPVKSTAISDHELVAKIETLIQKANELEQGQQKLNTLAAERDKFASYYEKTGDVFFQQQIQRIDADRNELQRRVSGNPTADILEMYRQIAGLSKTLFAPLDQQELLSQFYYFNYNSQRDNLRPVIQQFLPTRTNSANSTILGAFVLQGGYHCGLGFLQQIILDKCKIRTDIRPFVEVIEIFMDARSKAVGSEDSIWKSVAQRLRLTTTDPEQVVKAIHEKHKRMHVIISFKKAEHLATNVTILKGFWTSFQAAFERLPLNSNNKVLLFLQDVACKTKSTATGVVSDRQQQYEQQITKSNSIYLVPVVETVQEKDVSIWNKAYISYDLDLTRFKKEHYVLPAIREICRQLAHLDEHYQQFYPTRFSQYDTAL